MAAPNRPCPSCDTPVPEDAAYCPTYGVATPTEISQEAGADRTPEQPDADEAQYRERLQRALGDGYELRELIGRRGFGAVYAALRRVPIAVDQSSTSRNGRGSPTHARIWSALHTGKGPG